MQLKTNIVYDYQQVILSTIHFLLHQKQQLKNIDQISISPIL